MFEEPVNRQTTLISATTTSLRQAAERCAAEQHQRPASEHLLLLILDDARSIAGQALCQRGMTREILEQAILSLSPTNPADLEAALNLAQDEAQRARQSFITSDHLLLGLTRLAQGGAVEVLQMFRISPADVRRQVRQELQQTALHGCPADRM